MIQLDRVGCRVADRWALQEITLRVDPGEIVGLAGANGSGKSLLLAVCATLVRPDTGAVMIAGHDARSRPRAVRAVIGYVGESVGFYRHMTVREDLEFFARAARLSRADARAAAGAVLERVGLAANAALRMGEASRGLLRRVALARALVHRPRLLLLDDPESGVDQGGCALVSREIRAHVGDGGAVLVASCDAALARYTHRIVGLREGRLDEMRRGVVEPLGSVANARMAAAEGATA